MAADVDLNTAILNSATTSITSRGDCVAGNSNIGISDVPYTPSFKDSNLEEVMVRQLNEDILAYKYDLDFCEVRLQDLDLTPQETRTLQLRRLDLSHQIRHCQHRIETLKIQIEPMRRHNNDLHSSYLTEPGGGNTYAPRVRRSGAGSGLVMKRPGGTEVATPGSSTSWGKRRLPSTAGPEGAGPVKRSRTEIPPMQVKEEDHKEEDTDPTGGTSSLQRLGLWRCRLCSAPKYLLAGHSRVPAAPCKWPLKDVSKMIVHFTEMHTEHAPPERCAELGAALKMNRGPFEYWLRRTRAQNVGDGSMIDECIDSLLAGELPNLLRRLSRAAASMPAA